MASYSANYNLQFLLQNNGVVILTLTNTSDSTYNTIVWADSSNTGSKKALNSGEALEWAISSSNPALILVVYSDASSATDPGRCSVVHVKVNFSTNRVYVYSPINTSINFTANLTLTNTISHPIQFFHFEDAGLFSTVVLDDSVYMTQSGSLYNIGKFTMVGSTNIAKKILGKDVTLNYDVSNSQLFIDGNSILPSEFAAGTSHIITSTGNPNPEITIDYTNTQEPIITQT